MKILYMDYPAIGGETVKKVLKKLGHEVELFDFPHDSAQVRNGEELGVKIAGAIMQTQADLVFSFNFYPVVATAVHACRKKYVSWVYDCPTSLLYSMAVFFPENYIFHFDSSEVEKLRAKGVEHVYYLSLASNAEEYDLMIPDEKCRDKYAADIAMIGSMYRDKYHMFKKYEESFDDYLRGYLDGVVASQQELYGADILESALNDDIMSRILKAVPLPSERGDGFDTPRWIFANYYLGMRVTADERFRYLTELSGHYDTVIYTPSPVPGLLNVRNMGAVDYYNEAPYAIKCAKINLNITLHCILRGIPLRVMDILGCGGFLMSNYQADLCEEFVPGEDFVMFDSVEDAVEKAGYYLEHEEERFRIARNGHARVKELHGFERKCSLMLEAVTGQTL